MQRQLAELHTAREQFIATASHELRTPIFSLGGFLELLADEELDEETRRAFIEQVRGQVERLTKLTTELLDLSRLGSGAVTLRPEPTDLTMLSREVVAEFAPASTGQPVDVDAPAAGVEVLCDPERVAQVLRILMDNALVHTPPGTAIKVSAARVNGEARLSVTDAGQGIARKTMPHIFEPFFTAADDGTRGAGLGLAIASELAERMEGKLSAQSRPGTTTFTLVLPGMRGLAALLLCAALVGCGGDGETQQTRTVTVEAPATSDTERPAAPVAETAGDFDPARSTSARRRAS